MFVKPKDLTGAIKALIDEYKRAVNDLISVVRPIDKEELTRSFDLKTTDIDSKSVQNILAHVVSSAYSYSVYIENFIGLDTTRPEQKIFDDVHEYIEKLNSAVDYCENIFIQNPNLKLEVQGNCEKINTKWGQQYDIEQLLEHAIVHVLRHRRQIENIIGSDRWHH